MSKTKVNKYYRENGTKVRSHTRGLKTHKNTPRTIVGSNRAKRILSLSIWIILSISFLKVFVDTLEWSQRKPEAVKAQEVTPEVSPLTKEQGFEQVAPRDTVSREGRSESVEDKVRRVFNEEPDFAVKMAKAESSMRAEVINDNPKTGDYSVGVFQINLYKDLAKSRPSVEWLQIPENNIQFAKGLYDSCKTKTGNGWKCDWKTSWNKIK